MKKVLALLLVVLMALTLSACNKTDGTETASTSEDTTTSTAPESEEPTTDETATTDDAGTTDAETTDTTEDSEEIEPGFYNPETDYSQNERYEFVYMLFQNGVLYDMFDHAFSQWAEKANVEYSNWCANSDGDLFMTSIETFAAQGVDGILSDADMTMYERVNDVMNEAGMKWMPVMGTPLSNDGTLMHAYCGFDFYLYGEQMANWVIDYWEENFPEATLENSAMLCLDFSVSENLTVRVDAAEAVWNERYPGNEDIFFTADGVTGGLDSNTGYNISAPLIAAHPEIDYWIVCGLLDDYADGCARALEELGKDDTSVITVMGGSGLINHWDAGEDSCWKSACYTAETIYAEPIFFGLYDQVNGAVTQEELWPDWINHSNNDQYASLQLPSFFITIDTYQEYMEWCDAYTGINRSDYPYNGTEYSARMEVPDYYAG